jgi:predicted RNase H-like HicB family nuclease
MRTDHSPNGLRVRATWDDAAHVWVAESDDVPGLATEATTLEALLVKLRTMIPELLEANDGELPGEVPFELLTRDRTAGRRTGR